MAPLRAGERAESRNQGPMSGHIDGAFMSTYPFTAPDLVGERLDFVQDSPDVLHNVLAIAGDNLRKMGGSPFYGNTTCMPLTKEQQIRYKLSTWLCSGERGNL